MLKKIDLPGHDFEIVFSVGKMPKFTRKFIAICIYMPPSMTVQSANSCLSYLVDSIIELKERYRDPFIAISGDFNSYDVAGHLADYPDLVLVKTGPTRKNRTIDLVFTNFPEQIVDSGTISPLVNDSGVPSDHKVVYCSASLKRYEAYEWVTYSYMRQTDEGNARFKDWLLGQNWDEVYFAESSTACLLYTSPSPRD